MLAVLSPILVAICSGLAFLAYKHPEGFKRFASKLIIVNAVIYFTFVVYMFGFQSGFYAASKIENFEDGLPYSYGLATLIFFSCYIYLLILQNLQSIISERPE